MLHAKSVLEDFIMTGARVLAAVSRTLHCTVSPSLQLCQSDQVKTCPFPACVREIGFTCHRFS